MEWISFDIARYSFFGSLIPELTESNSLSGVSLKLLLFSKKLLT
ncbi:MAG: hypothetical protein ACFFB0_12125 [Promethearchaeota archaeon]